MTRIGGGGGLRARRQARAPNGQPARRHLGGLRRSTSAATRSTATSRSPSPAAACAFSSRPAPSTPTRSAGWRRGSATRPSSCPSSAAPRVSPGSRTSTTRTPAAILTDLAADDVARLGDELTRTRDGQLVLGRAVAAAEAARWTARRLRARRPRDLPPPRAALSADCEGASTRRASQDGLRRRAGAERTPAADRSTSHARSALPRRR